MTIEVVPHDAKYTPAVEMFNSRMRAGGSKWGFYPHPEPDWIPYKEGAPSWREYHLALEDNEEVRGGYALKPQRWIVHGSQTWVTDWQGPFTEAEINPKYSPLMLRLARAAAKQYENLFSLGHSEKDAAVLTRMGWGTTWLPFSFSVVHAHRFFKEASYLRKTPLRRIGCNLLAYSGAGAALFKAIEIVKRVLAGTSGTPSNAQVVDCFGDWADTLWHNCKDAYQCLAVRDRAMMNALVPASGWPGGTRLKVSSGDDNIGWSVVLIKNMNNDERYGNMTVGLIADAFGHPERAREIIAATVRYLKTQSVDMICCNMSHPAWVNGLNRTGFVTLPDRRIFAYSPSLKSALGPEDSFSAGIHLTNLDGHGPHGFTFAD